LFGAAGWMVRRARLSPSHRDELSCRLFEFFRRYFYRLAFVSRVDFANPFELRGPSL
jgi:hypothetical protein